MKNIEKFRALNDMTQKQLGEELGLSRVWISMLEKPGYFNIEEEYVEKMCEIFNVSKVELFGFENFRYLPENDNQVMYLIKILYNFIEDESTKEMLEEVLVKYGYFKGHKSN